MIDFWNSRAMLPVRAVWILFLLITAGIVCVTVVPVWLLLWHIIPNLAGEAWGKLKNEEKTR